MNQFYDINDMDFVIHWNVKKMEFDDVLKSIKIGNILHKGVLSEVYEGFSYTQNKRIAIKIFEKKGKTSKQRKMIEKEINIALKLNHPNIVKVHTVMEDKERVYIVMDYLGKYNLKSYSNKRLKEEKSSFSKEEIYSITHDLVSSINYLHTMRYCHRHITLSNIMFYKGRAVLIDFGLALSVTGTKKKKVCGTPAYMAPEMLKEEGYNGMTIDIWCLGVGLYRLICGKYPFGQNEENLKDYILNHSVIFSNGFSSAEKTFITKLLDKNFRRRPTIKTVSYEE